jgi:NAD(P)-dependent dehydrogenase (short-subunit alcohol dehydrogenase family)
VKKAIVTGAYGAIGAAIAMRIAEAGFNLCLVGRDEKKLKDLAGNITRKTGNPEITFEVVDLSSGAEIHAMAHRWKGPVTLLVNNAATAPSQRMESKEGVELQFAVNVLGYFRMIREFHKFMEGLDDVRIVNVASYWAGGLDLSDPEFRRRKYDNDQAYRQSKQADRMLTVAFAEFLKEKNISVNACHPGDVNSKLSNDLGFGGHETPDEGAATPVWLALSPEVKKIAGGYFANLHKVHCEFSDDKKQVQDFYSLCLSYG